MAERLAKLRTRHPLHRTEILLTEDDYFRFSLATGHRVNPNHGIYPSDPDDRLLNFVCFEHGNLARVRAIRKALVVLTPSAR